MEVFLRPIAASRGLPSLSSLSSCIESKRSFLAPNYVHCTRIYVCVCVYIYIVFERVICCSIGRLTFSLDREEEKEEKEEEYFSSKRKNNPSRFYDRERERERKRLYDVITFSQGDVKSLGSDTSFSREKERERRLILPRRNLLSRSISRSRDKRVRGNVKRYEKMANTNVNRRGEEEVVDRTSSFHFSLLLFDTHFERSSGKKERTTKVYDGKIVRIGPN